MIEMDVRDQDGVDVLRHLRGRSRAVAAQMTQARAQQRVGQQPRAPELEQHGGVTDPGQALVIARHGDHRSAAGGEAASPQVGEPASPAPAAMHRRDEAPTSWSRSRAGTRERRSTFAPPGGSAGACGACASTRQAPVANDAGAGEPARIRRESQSERSSRERYPRRRSHGSRPRRRLHHRLSRQQVHRAYRPGDHGAGGERHDPRARSALRDRRMQTAS